MWCSVKQNHCSAAWVLMGFSLEGVAMSDHGDDVVIGGGIMWCQMWCEC